MSKPKSEKLCPGVEQIPFEALERLGAIFEEGRVKDGLDNWKSSPGDQEYNIERTRHAIRHLMLYANGDRQEDHLAKVMWYCVTTIWRTNHNTERRSYSSANSSNRPSEASGTMDPNSWTDPYPSPMACVQQSVEQAKRDIDKAPAQLPIGALLYAHPPAKESTEVALQQTKAIQEKIQSLQPVDLSMYAVTLEPTIYTPEEYAAKQKKEQPSE